RRRPDPSRHLAAAPRLAAARRPDQPHAPARDETLVLLLEAGRDAAHLDGGPFRRWASRGDGERLLPAVAIEIEETADDLLRLGEGTVDRGVVLAPLPDAGALLLGEGERLRHLELALRLEVLGKGHHL